MPANWILALESWRHVSSTYRLIAKQDVDIRHDLHQGLLEELADERRWEVHAEDLVVFWSMLCHLQDWLHGHSQEKSLETRTVFIYIMLKQSDLHWTEQICLCSTSEQAALSLFWQHNRGQTELKCRFLLTETLSTAHLWVLDTYKEILGFGIIRITQSKGKTRLKNSSEMVFLKHKQSNKEEKKARGKKKIHRGQSLWLDSKACTGGSNMHVSDDRVNKSLVWTLLTWKQERQVHSLCEWIQIR